MTSSVKIAVVTGSSKGLGLAIARRLAKHEDIRVVLTSRRDSDGLEAQQHLANEGLQVDYHTLDVNSDESVNGLAQWLQTSYGRVDILVNNAGVNPTMQPEEASWLTVKLDTLRSTLETNVVAVLRVTQALLPMMQAQNYGRIVNVSTEMASMASLGADYYPLAPSYRLSKVGLNGLTAILAKELNGSNILINAYSPGWLQTDMGGPDAPFTPDEGAETAEFLATLPDGGSHGKFYAEMRKFGGAFLVSW